MPVVKGISVKISFLAEKEIFVSVPSHLGYVDPNYRRAGWIYPFSVTGFVPCSAQCLLKLSFEIYLLR